MHSTPRRRSSAQRLVSLAALAVCPAAFAAKYTSTWVGSTNGSWGDATRWSNNPSYLGYPNNQPDPLNPGQYFASFDVNIAHFNTPCLVTMVPAQTQIGDLYPSISVDNLAISGPQTTVAQYGDVRIGGALNVSAGAFRVLGTQLTAGSVNVSGGLLQLASGTLTTGVLNLSAGTVELAGGVIGSTTFNAGGGTILGGALDFAGPVQIHFTGSQVVFDGTQLLGGLSFDQDYRQVQLRNNASFDAGGATLNRTGSNLRFSATTTKNTFDIASTIDMDAVASVVTLEGGTLTLNLKPTARVRGRGTVTSGGSFGGVFTLDNEGVLGADLPGQLLEVSVPVQHNKSGGVMAASGGGILSINPGTLFQNEVGGVLSATGGSQLNLLRNWHNAGTLILQDTSSLGLGGTFTFADLGLSGWQRTGGQVNVPGTLDLSGNSLVLTSAYGDWRLTGGTLRNGTVQPTADGRVIFDNNSANALDGMTYAGPLVLDQTFGRVRLRNGTTLGGPANLTGLGAMLAFEGTAATPAQTLTNDVNLDNGTANSGARLSLEGAAPQLTIPAGRTVRGSGSITFASLAGVSGVAAVDNLGLVSADRPGEPLTLNVLKFANQAGSVVRAINGGQLVISPGVSFGTPISTFDNLPGGTLSVTGGSTLTLLRAWHNAGTFILADSSLLSLQGTFATADLGLAGWQRTGGTVRLQGLWDNTGAMADLSLMGSVALSGGTIQGGIIKAAAGAELVPDTNTANILDAVALQGPLTLNTASQRVRLRNDANFSGYTATVSGLGASISFEGTATDNTGALTSATVQLGNSLATLSIDRPGFVFTIAPNASVRGFGQLAAGLTAGSNSATTLANQGTVSADVAGQVLVFTLPTLVNTGVLEARNGGVLQLFAQHASQAAGTFHVAGGALQVLDSTSGPEIVVGPGATLAGWGEVRFAAPAKDSVTLAGTLDPELGAGGLVIKGDLVPQTGSVLSFDIAGTAAGTGYDTVSEAGGAGLNLNGAQLRLRLGGGFRPTPAQSFTVLTSTMPLTGAFANVASGARLDTVDGTGSFLVSYTGSTVVLSAFQLSAQAVFADWIATRFPGVTDPSVIGYTADPDGDDAPNWLEFALGGDPAVANGAGEPRACVLDVDPSSGSEACYVVATRIGATFSSQVGGAQASVSDVDGVSYAVEASADLAAYTLPVLHAGVSSAAPAGTGLPSLAGTAWEYHMFYVAPASRGVATFFRVRCDFAPLH